MTNRNVHIYYSEMRNESRIFKITRTLNQKSLFDEILIIGRAASDLERRETLYSNTNILRLGVLNHPLSNAAPLFYAAAWYLAAVFWVVRLGPSYLSIHSVSLLPLASVAKLIRPRTKIIYETHELETETNGASLLKRSIRKVIEYCSFWVVHHAVVVSPSILDWYRERHKGKEISVVMNCPNFSGRQENNQYLRQHFALPDDSVLFLYQGIMAPGRGIDKLVSAFEELPTKAVLILLGYGPDFEKWLQMSEASERLFVHPVVPHETVLEVTSSADCGLSFMEDTCLSHRYALPNKLFEFIQARLPVIVSPTIDQKHLVEHEGIGVACDNFGTQAIVAACQNVMSDRMIDIDKRLDEVALKYCWEQQEQCIEKIYKS